MDMKGERDRNTVIVDDFNTPLISMDRSSRQNWQEDSGPTWHTRSSGFNWYLQSILLPNSRIYILFKCTWKVHYVHMLGHKKCLNKFKKIEIISSTCSDHSAMKLEINHKRRTEKHTKTWKLNNMLLNNERVNKIKEENKIPWNKWNENKTI